MASSQQPSQRRNWFLSRLQLEDLLQRMGVIVAGDTSTDIIAYCPFHQNKDSPAFNISLNPPHLWKCHNGKCAKQGNVLSLLTLKGYSRREAEKMLLNGEVEIDDFVTFITELMGTEKEEAVDEWRGVDPEVFRTADREAGYPVRLYMSGRGIHQAAYDYFGIGYSSSKGMLVVPVFDAGSRLCGVIGRELSTKRYKYSTGLGRGQIVWNLNNAKVHDTIILTEGSLDAIYLWQAGFENVGAVLGSSISPRQWDAIRKEFAGVVCFFDNDEAGNALRDSVIESVRDLEVSFVNYPNRLIPFIGIDGEHHQRLIKDPGELTTEEIQDMLRDRKTSLDVLLYG